MPQRFQKLPEVPNDMPVHHRAFFTAIRNALNTMGGSASPVGAPANFTATAIVFGAVIQFSKDIKADDTILYIGTTADVTQAHPVSLGVSTRFTDNQGKSGVKVWYWLQSRQTGHPPSAIVGPVQVTTLASGTAATLPKQPPAATIPLLDASNRTPVFVKEGDV